jgi:O-antigen/teichoic acid export membrane protein
VGLAGGEQGDALPGLSWTGSARRAGWGLVDQTLSSVTNFAVFVLVARTVAPSELGAFSLGFALYLLTVDALRSVAVEPMLVRSSTAGSEGHRASAGAVTGLAVTVGAGIGILAVGAGLVIRGTTGSVLVPLGIALPGLLLQDAWRGVFFARGRPVLAAANDAVWATAQLVAVGAVIGFGFTGPGIFVAAWGAAGTFAGIVGIAQSRVWPRPAASLAWFRSHRDLGIRFGAEFAAIRGSSQANLVILGVIAGLGAVGEYRGSLVLMNPTNVISLAVPLVAIPEAVRHMHRGAGRLMVVARTASLSVAILVAIWGAIVLALPTSVGKELLGQSWEGARILLPAVVIRNLADGLSGGAMVGLRARANARASLRVQLILTALVLTLGPAAMLVDGASGLAWALAAISVFGVVLWWWTFRRGGEPVGTLP